MTTRTTFLNKTPSGRRIRTAAAITALGLFGLGLGGCNSSNTALMEANRALQDRNTALTQENQSLTSLVQQLQGAVAARDKAMEEQNRLIADLRAGMGGNADQLAAMQRRIEGMNFGNLTMLDETTDKALRDLASQHSDLLEYDAARGLLRFKSDVTFDSGSDVVRSSAKSTLSALAGILNGAASQYDCRVVGHTDSQRLSSGTRQKHTTNIRLSCDRAISVRNELVNSGVMAARFEVGGRGEFDPMVPNSSNGNTAQNRRVEVYLVKSREKIAVTPMSDSAPSAPAPAPRSQPASSNDDVMK